jgi:hypothetical protein
MNWDAVTKAISQFVQAAEPIVNAAVAIEAPEASAGLAIGEKVLQGVLDGEPTAQKLYDQIVGGTPVTQDQIKELEANYEADYQKTKADIAAKLASVS